MSAVRALTPTSYSRSINRLYPFVFAETPQPPVLLGSIPNISTAFNSGTHQYDLSVYASGQTSYSISPALEAGWSLNTSTGLLEIDTDDEGTFGSYTLTFTNAQGDTDSNAFGITVSESTGGSRRRLYVPPLNTRRKKQPMTTQALINRISRIIR